MYFPFFGFENYCNHQSSTPDLLELNEAVVDKFNHSLAFWRRFKMLKVCNCKMSCFQQDFVFDGNAQRLSSLEVRGRNDHPAHITTNRRRPMANGHTQVAALRLVVSGETSPKSLF